MSVTTITSVRYDRYIGTEIAVEIDRSIEKDPSLLAASRGCTRVCDACSRCRSMSTLRVENLERSRALCGLSPDTSPKFR